jgi:hypothetical protein
MTPQQRLAQARARGQLTLQQYLDELEQLHAPVVYAELDTAALVHREPAVSGDQAADDDNDDEDEDEDELLVDEDGLPYQKRARHEKSGSEGDFDDNDNDDWIDKQESEAEEAEESEAEESEEEESEKSEESEHEVSEEMAEPSAFEPGDVCVSDPPKGDAGHVNVVRIGTAADFLHTGKVYVSYVGAAKRYL